MYSEALRARDWNERKIGDLISPQKAKKADRIDQPAVQDFNDTISDLFTDPLISLVLPMNITLLEFDKTIMGIRKVSEVFDYLYKMYQGPEVTPMMAKLVTEVREVMETAVFHGEVKRNLNQKPYISFLQDEIESFKQLKHDEFIELMWTTLEQEEPQFDYEIDTL